MKTFRIAFAALFSVGTLSCALKHEARSDGPARDVAQTTLKAFQDSMDDSMAHNLGFGSLADAKAGRLGTSIPVYDMVCDSVKKAEGNGTVADPRKMGARDKYYFPIQDASGRYHALILIKKLSQEDGYGKPGEWSPVLVGASAFSKRLDSALQGQPEDKRSSLFLAQSPVMGASFLAHEESGTVDMRPLALHRSTDSCMNFPSRGKDMPANKLLADLSRCSMKDACAEFSPEAAKADPKRWGWNPKPSSLK